MTTTDDGTALSAEQWARVEALTAAARILNSRPSGILGARPPALTDDLIGLAEWILDPTITATVDDAVVDAVIYCGTTLAGPEGYECDLPDGHDGPHSITITGLPAACHQPRISSPTGNGKLIVCRQPADHLGACDGYAP